MEQNIQNKNKAKLYTFLIALGCSIVWFFAYYFANLLLTIVSYVSSFFMIKIMYRFEVDKKLSFVWSLTWLTSLCAVLSNVGSILFSVVVGGMTLKETLLGLINVWGILFVLLAIGINFLISWLGALSYHQLYISKKQEQNISKNDDDLKESQVEITKKGE